MPIDGVGHSVGCKLSELSGVVNALQTDELLPGNSPRTVGDEA